jgi:hypothetical protein
VAGDPPSLINPGQPVDGDLSERRHRRIFARSPSAGLA